MSITAIPGSPLYEEMVRRSMVNAQSGQPAVQNSDVAGYNPIMAPNYADWSKMAAMTAANYGIVDKMLQVNPAMSQAYSGQAYGGGSSAGAGVGGASGYGGIDPALLAAMNADYDRSRLGMMGAERAYEKRLRGDFNERFGGAETGLLGRAEQTSRDQMSGQLAGLEQQRNLALAQARERAEERALRAREAEQARKDRQLAAANQAYSQSSYGSGAGGYGSEGQYGQADYLSGGGVGATFTGGRDPGSVIPGSRVGGGGGGGGGGSSGGSKSSAPPPGAPGYVGPDEPMPPPMQPGDDASFQAPKPSGMQAGAGGLFPTNYGGTPKIGAGYDPRVTWKAPASAGGMTSIGSSYR